MKRRNNRITNGKAFVFLQKTGESKKGLMTDMMAILSVIFGITIFLCLALGLLWAALIIGIIGVLLSFYAKKTTISASKRVRSTAKAGLICTIAGLSTVILLLLMLSILQNIYVEDVPPEQFESMKHYQAGMDDGTPSSIQLFRETLAPGT